MFGRREKLEANGEANGDGGFEPPSPLAFYLMNLLGFVEKWGACDTDFRDIL